MTINNPVAAARSGELIPAHRMNGAHHTFENFMKSFYETEVRRQSVLTMLLKEVSQLRTTVENLSVPEPEFDGLQHQALYVNDGETALEFGRLFLGRQGLVAVEIDSAVTPAEIEEHYVKFGSVFDLDGRRYVSLERGPQIVYAKEEETESTADVDVEGSLEIVVSHTTVGTFTATSALLYSLVLEESGGRSTEFQIQAYKNSSAIGSIQSIFLTGDVRVATASFVLATPPVATDVYDLRVEGIGSHQQAIAFVRGSVDATLIRIVQEGA